MEGLTINQAASTTGWSPRMLRYIESAGLIELPRTPSGYRVFGPGELQRLRTLPIAPARASPRPRALPPRHHWRTPPHDRHRDHHTAGLQGRRPVARRVRAQGDHACRARDARPDGDARRVRLEAAAPGRAHHRLAPHDRADGRADRDAG